MVSCYSSEFLFSWWCRRISVIVTEFNWGVRKDWMQHQKNQSDARGRNLSEGKKQEHWSSIIAPFPIWLASSLLRLTISHLGILPPDIEYWISQQVNIVRKRVLLKKIQKYLLVGNFTMGHITNYSAHLESPSVKQLCEQTHVHRWEPISDKMFTNKRIDLLANLGRLTPKLFANGKHR